MSSIDTPLMRQYLEIKNQHRDALLFFRMGDFYEMFFDDAVVAAQALELTLTSRDRNREDPVPMCGVPHHAVNGYVRKLLDLGHKVALCDQIEDPKLARGLVKRAVTQIVTPGVVLDTEHLEEKSNNYLLTLTTAGDRYGLAALDLSTFELRTTEVEGTTSLLDEIARLQPKEVICDERAMESRMLALQPAARAWRPGAAELFRGPEEDGRLIEEKGGGCLKDLGLDDMALAVKAAAAAIRYAAATQPMAGLPSCRVICYHAKDYLQIDESTFANLEVFCSLMERQRRGSLIGILDGTLTAMGGRSLRQWLSRPLLDVAAIRRRQDAVELLAEQSTLRRELREILRRVYDLERLTSRTVMQIVTPRELGRMGRSLEEIPALGRLLIRGGGSSLSRELPELLHPPEDLLQDLAAAIGRALVEDPPLTSREGGIFRLGFHAELDELVRLSEGGKAEMMAIEARERERTGIASLKVRYNRVFGYFLEVTRANLKNVPQDYQRKQTLANAERFITPELAEYETKVLGAEEQRVVLEQELFEELRRRVAGEAERLTRLARWVASLDVLAALAEAAQAYDYIRPEVDEGDVISIEEGRHPVVERFLPAGQFVPNDLLLDPAGNRMLILTGPNMAGKSTVIRQTALITLLAQIGSFVPARRARIGAVDRIFTRVGASDNLARGESTFMVEMRETASILRHATSRSLIVLDEIGRGTATYDGISIAWAVAEHLHDRVKAKCLFATHYHELCALGELKLFVKNFNIAVQEWKEQIVFLRKLVPGGSSRSYGIEVARLAGMDRSVVARARKILGALESGEPLAGLTLRGHLSEENVSQLALFKRSSGEEVPSPDEMSVLAELREIEPNSLTPLEALNRLADWTRRLSG